MEADAGRINPLDYYTEEEWARFRATSEKLPTPFVLINPEIVKKNYESLVKNFPYGKVYYAIKANPHDQVVTLLRDLGSCFDIASIYELDKALRLGIEPERLSYGNTIKKARDIKYFYDKGVRLFATDSESDVRKIAENAPGSKVFCRILVDGGTTADWPLSRKFGCQPEMAHDLLRLSKALGLIPTGISFHVGSQQRNISSWEYALKKTKAVFDRLEKEEGIVLSLINMGGGLPAAYISPTDPITTYSEHITGYLKSLFGETLPEIIMEPGRSLVAECGVVVTEVVMKANKSVGAADKWMYVDAGKFNGLVETMDECIKYPLWCDRDGPLTDEYIIAGPSCDSADVMYEKFRNPLPEDLQEGDRLFWLTCGAYTSSYASREFNGFPPIDVHVVE